MGKRSILLWAGAILLACAVGVAIALSIPWFPSPAFSEARSIGSLFNFILVVVVVIFVLVEGLLVYSLVRFRRQPGEEGDGPPVHGNTPLEITWTVIPALIVLVIGIYSFKVLQDLEASPQSLQEPLVVKVIARQWAWQFEYPEYKISSAELHLPVGRSVEFQITSMDVIHSFWLPSLRQKMDALPEMVTVLRATPTTPGDYEVICAELCGLGHAMMKALLRVEEGSVFQAWLEQQQARVQGGDPLSVRTSAVPIPRV